LRGITLWPEVQGQTAAAVKRGWIGWAPLILLPLSVITLRARTVPWAFMWLLAAAIFAGCKWQTWWEARGAGYVRMSWRRNAAYLLLWPGMNARECFDGVTEKRRVPLGEWLAGIAKTLAGIALIGGGGRLVSSGRPMLGGWTGMVGLVLVLHFGTFHLLALAWQRAGVDVKRIMQEPLASVSLGELWGKRWNLGFRTLSHTWIFQPLQKRFGPAAGTLGAFLASGLLHDLVISAPARGGYGLPTAYFLVQGLGVIAERSETGQRFDLGRGVRGWFWTALIAAGPVYALFHPWFVMRVIVPFLRTIAG
jgi:Membrane bound O-acyl transferase family